MCTEFAKRLKLLREEHSIQQKELAKYLDYVGSAISNYETRRNKSPLARHQKIYSGNAGGGGAWEFRRTSQYCASVLFPIGS